MKTIILYLFLFCFLSPISSTTKIMPTPTPTPSIIQRATKQQIITTIPPNAPNYPPTPTSAPFLISPSGKYAAFLLRTPTALAAGGFGNDFCYVQIQDSESHQIMWESECAPVSTSNACSLIFDDAGLEVFDGSNSVYNTEADGDHINRLELVDEGDMRLVDKEGELAWKASDEPRGSQGCGLPGSVGLAPNSPPFSDLIGSGADGPFGQPAGAGAGQGQQAVVDESGFVGSGSLEVKVSWFGVGMVSIVALMFGNSG